MNYRKRHIEKKLLQLQNVFSSILLTGARQVGKSTLLSHIFPDIRHIVFDPAMDIENARADPEFFLDQHPPPIILDEIQYAPELLPALKRRIDRYRAPAQYYLTGSQNLAMIQSVSESLAGRVVILELSGMSLGERLGQSGDTDPCWLETLLAAGTTLPSLEKHSRYTHRAPLNTLFDIIWRGGFPGSLDLPNDVLPDFFHSYMQTYVERDIRRLAEVSDQQIFSRFTALCAAMSAQEINFSQLGRDIGVTPQTAGRWLAILKGTYQWFEIPPYSGNTLKKISGKPKGYFTDTGLASFLHRVSSPQALSGHPLWGALFETHVVLDIHRLFCRLTTPPRCYHWRSHAGAEVDLILERDNIFWPIEIKCKAKITTADARGINLFRRTYPSLPQGTGLIIAAVETVTPLPDNVLVIPYDLV